MKIRLLKKLRRMYLIEGRNNKFRVQKKGSSGFNVNHEAFEYNYNKARDYRRACILGQARNFYTTPKIRIY